MIHVLIIKSLPYIGLCCSLNFKLYIETTFCLILLLAVLKKIAILVAFLFFTRVPFFSQTSPFLGTIVWLAVRSPQVSHSRLEVKAAPWREYWWPSRRTHPQCHIMKIFAIIVIVGSAISTSEVVKNYPRLSQLPDLALLMVIYHHYLWSSLKLHPQNSTSMRMTTRWPTNETQARKLSTSP